MLSLPYASLWMVRFAPSRADAALRVMDISQRVENGCESFRLSFQSLKEQLGLFFIS